jgi:beta-carotene 3-hydroxylase
MVYIALFIAAFLFMEFIAWSNHKYIMHGFLWKWHKDHHVNELKKDDPEILPYSGFEKNDLFALVYAIPAAILIILGFSYQKYELVAIGFGFTFYGFIYFFIHEVIIHHRFKVPFFQKNHGAYLRALIKAHKAHHRPKNVKDFGNFGLIIFQPRFFKK